MASPTMPRPTVGMLFRPPVAPERTGGSAGAGALRSGPRVLLLPHDDCDVCRRWAGSALAGAEEDLRRWDGRIVELGPELRSRDPEAAWLAVVDEWDEVYHVATIGADHDFPDLADVVEWVRFVAIQCPECEAPEWPWVGS